ncbi:MULTISPECIES: pirin family protein [unclassified Legionella]|uniref:pirin family protein n=1 Tax=unclassified Legionella TaxID=2622702 RepID=UPI001055502D|nr:MULTISPECIES: pirin family protein [unclassified Legionella]MDI9817968.1 pirin family protein [Legionella sp. PL877]
MDDIRVEKLLTGTLMREGAGVKLHRYIGSSQQNEYDPILLFDFFDSDQPMDYLGGFPQHPHRGFETVTYMLNGQMLHRDNHGHQGVIGPGDVQWMTAGRGIIHSEMPKQTEGRLTGLQLWFNLPAAKKWSSPHYQEFTAAQLPVETHDSAIEIKVIAGKTDKGTASPIQGIATAPLFFDISLPAGQAIQQSIPAHHQAILFVLSGSCLAGNQPVHSGVLAILSPGNKLVLKGLTENARCLLIAAKKLQEPVAWLGPFVMNTQAEVLQALDDYRNKRF